MAAKQKTTKKVAKKAVKKTAKKVTKKAAKKVGKKAARKGTPKAASPRRPARAPEQGSLPLERVGAIREIFWNNVMRELLTSLSVLSAQRDAGSARLPPGGGASPGGGTGVLAAMGVLPIGDPAQEEDGEEEEHGTIAGPIPPGTGVEPGDIFDGRLAVVTSLGQRIPVAEVHPVFACGVKGAAGEDPLSSLVECTVFEITTPGGEVFTLPIHEIRSFHALTPELLEQIGREVARTESSPGGEAMPFGFAAFTSLSRASGAPPLHRVDADAFGE